MSTPHPLGATRPARGPIAWLGRTAIGFVSYAGGLGVLVVDALRAAVRLGPLSKPMRGAVTDELSWLFALGLPLVGLVHVGMGGFLAMQAYYGGTFLDGTGAVVGVGLFRNVAPQLACLVLTGLLCARVTPEFRSYRRDLLAAGPDGPPRPGFLERSAQGRRAGRNEAGPTFGPEGFVAARLAAAAITGPVLSLWGGIVGTVVGWRVARSLMGVTTHGFFLMFWEMLWARDFVGLVVKGSLFGLAAAIPACYEGLRPSDDLNEPGGDTAAAGRAACLAVAGILFVNSTWFVLAYHAGPAFGPTLLTPPNS